MKESCPTKPRLFESGERDLLNRSPEEAFIDHALIQAIAAGRQIALNELYCRYRLLVKKVIAQALPNEADVDETLQDVFLGIWNNAAKFNPQKGAVLGWIICIARRRAVDHHRRTRRFTAHTIQLNTTCSEVWGDGNLRENPTAHHDEPASHDLLDHLLGIVAVLSPEQRQVIQLTYFESLSQRQIAARTGIPLGTIKRVWNSLDVNFC